MDRQIDRWTNTYVNICLYDFICIYTYGEGPEAPLLSPATPPPFVAWDLWSCIGSWSLSVFVSSPPMWGGACGVRGWLG